MIIRDTSWARPQRQLRRNLSTAAVLAVSLHAAFGAANWVYHERTGNGVAGGAPGCSGTVPYVEVLTPTPAQAYTLHFKIEYHSSTDFARVYYTTNGSAPA